MFRKLVVLISLLLLAGSAMAADWSKTTNVYFGRGQHLSGWEESDSTRIFMADSSSKLYYRQLDDTDWSAWEGLEASNPRGVVGVIGHDTLLISRWGYGLDEEAWGVYRCSDPKLKTTDFVSIMGIGGFSLRNRQVNGLEASANSDTVVYAMSEQWNDGESWERGFQWTYNYGTNWRYVLCDPDLSPPFPWGNDRSELGEWIEGEITTSVDEDLWWYTSIWSPDTSSSTGVWSVYPTDYTDCGGGATKVFNANVRGLAGYIDDGPNRDLFAGVYTGDSAGLWMSTNSGTTWDTCAGAMYPITTVDLSYDASGGFVLAGTEGHGILRSSDSGGTWGFANSGIRCKNIQKVQFAHPIDSGVVYALGQWSVYKSIDFGATWTEDIQGLPNAEVNAVAANHPDWYMLGAFDILHKKSGSTFKNYYAFEGEPSFDTLGHTVATHLTVFPNANQHLFVSTYEPDSKTTSTGKGKVYRSKDGGNTWSLVFWPTTAGQTGHISSIVVDPSDDSTVFVTYDHASSIKIVKSTSYGDSASWSFRVGGISAGLKAKKIAINPRNSDVVYLASDGDGVYKSTNGGGLWSSSGLNGRTVRDIAVLSSDTSVLYAATDTGVYISTDRAGSWSLVDSGMTRSNAYSLALKPPMNEEVYVACVNADTGFVYVSGNRGTSWTDVSSGLPSKWLVTRCGTPSVNLEIDSPDKPTILYIGTTRGLYELDIDDYSGTIASNTTWDLSDIYVNGDITVSNGAKLTVGAGVLFNIEAGDKAASGLDTTKTEITVAGELELGGTSGSHVVFDEDADWYGIIIDTNGSGIIRYADFNDAYAAITNNGSDNDTVANCFIDSSGMYGILTKNSNLVVHDTRIEDMSTGYGIYVDACAPTIVDDSIVACDIGVYLNSSNITLRDCYIEGDGTHGVKLNAASGSGPANIINLEIIGSFESHVYANNADFSIDSCTLETAQDTTRSDYGVMAVFTDYFDLRRTMIENYDAAGIYAGYSNTTDWDLGQDVTDEHGDNSIETDDGTSYAIDGTWGPSIAAEQNWWGSDNPDSSLFQNAVPGYYVDFVPYLTTDPLSKVFVHRGDLAIPGNFTLSQNYPNPFNPSTTIEFDLPASSYVTLRVYNILGQEVVTLVNTDYPSGHYTVTWDGRDGGNKPVASGIYFYRLSTDLNGETKKMILLK